MRIEHEPKAFAWRCMAEAAIVQRQKMLISSWEYMVVHPAVLGWTIGGTPSRKKKDVEPR